MLSPPDGQNSIWPCYSCCRQVWVPETAAFSDGCPGLVAYIPALVAIVVVLGRYSLRPLWRRRPIWLRDFATEKDELGPATGWSLPDDDEADEEEEAEAPFCNRPSLAVEPDSFTGRSIEFGTTAEVISNNDSDDSNEITIVSPGNRFTLSKIRIWTMEVTLFLLSLIGVITSLLLTFAAGLGLLYLTPLVPCLASCLLLAIDRPRTLPGAVYLLHAATLAIQLALLLGVPDLYRWPLCPLWLSEISVTGLSLAIMTTMPLRDPSLGNRASGTDGETIALPFETPSNKLRSPEDALTLWQWMTVSWMGPLIGLGYTRQLHSEDVWNLPYQFQHGRLYRLFQDVRGTVTSRVVKVNTPDLIITSVLGILDSLLSMLPIVFLKALLASMEGSNPNVRVATIYAVLICITNLLRSQCGVFSLWYARRCYERSRGELITMIYEKTLRRKAFTFPSHTDASTKNGGEVAEDLVQGPASTGKILNLMRNDVYEVAQRFWEFPTLFTKPLNFVLSMVLLWRILGAASLVGILVVVMAQLINVFVIRILVRWETARRAVTDIKLQVTSQFIESIRHLRWYDWQDRWLADILKARQKELRYRVITNIIQRIISVVNQMSASFFPVAAFYAYTVWERRPLTVDVAFPALNLFNLLEQSLRELPDLITVLLNATVAMRRIDAFMSEPEKESDGAADVILKQAPGGAIVDGILRPPGPLHVEITDGSFSWPTVKKPVLTKVDLIADGGSLTVIFGKVGTGKTALLMSILGEMDQHSGTRFVPRETIGYCAQTPWLQSMSVRENILFCTPFDEQRYNSVVEACCLLQDFSEFEAGDMSNIGENGIGLSGGQKARVALARAVYSRARILLLDDPIAALDHNTAESIMKKLFTDSGLMRNRLALFVTHRLDLVAGYADQIYEVSDENGIVTKVDIGTVRKSAGVSAAAPTTTADSEGSSAADDNEGDSSPENNVAGKPASTTNGANKFIEEEYRAHGGVMMSVYWRYVKAGGLRWWVLTLFTFIGFRIAKIAYLYFLKIWGEAYDKDATADAAIEATLTLVPRVFTYLQPWKQLLTSGSHGDEDMFSIATVVNPDNANTTGWYEGDFGLPSPMTNVVPWLLWLTLLAIFTLLFRTLSDIILIIITYVAGKRVFQEVMVRVSTAPFRFFDITPVGRLMNRVTSDIGTIDGAVAQQIHRCAWFMLNWLTSILVIATATPTFLAMAVFMTVAFVLVFIRFLPTSQSLRRLEMVSLSPLMSNFGTLLEGLTTVRAFRAQPDFQERIISTTDAFQRMDHFYWSLQAWLQWRFNSMTALSTFALTITALATGLSSGLVAFVLTAAANFVNSTQVLCRRYGELQMQFVSVERVIELLDLDQEPIGDIDPPAAWPTTNDDIVFDDVTVRYAPHLEPSLRNITMRIPAGSTVAVTGRTGSGKSTLALALLGTVLPDNNEATQGSIYIGGMDVAKVNKHALRQRISFVAQDPVLFPGTLRENLDPIGHHTDEECIAVLAKVLGDATGEFKLDSRIDGGGKNMSQGQRQLVGLGRAVLRRSPIVILDEATASIDKATAFRIQEVLREELKHSTVITIAHRLEAVRDADFSVILENGRVVLAAPVTELS
ncbi:ABC bile acid transporter [Grosmannia clavigera kw1407]|uniref:ABC bile acid transporter n=1 Tax=Grosmannia clavigera (strain kw1407 / UAMH 11150) TaxID=655863 RepID=F0XPJ5_GROCL|nr:ABC bile acid transporter [Grosmannia clavigera kw1407]EFX00086.1 ABC bile acid transporter [Grosmannia clavigera kw1407]